MANKEHLEWFNRGADEWNQVVNAGQFRLDLSHANLQEADLRGYSFRKVFMFRANLRRAILNHSDLSGADLSEAQMSEPYMVGANLSYADLSRARLTGANLNQADLPDANLHAAELAEADLRDADLRLTYFLETNLKNANLSGAMLQGTIFADTDLSDTFGLEEIQHLGPSTIGIDSVVKSKGKLPQVFLRGAGLSDQFISYIPSLVHSGIEFYSCFISCSHADRGFARRLHDTLQGRGVRCWLDEHQLLPGHKIFNEVDAAIRLWDKVLLCCSKSSLSSWWVDNEIKIAFDKEQQLWKQRGKEVQALIPLNLDGHLFTGEWKSGLTTEVKSRLAADFTGWEYDNEKFEGQFERLIRALRPNQRGKEPPPKSLL